MDTLAFLRKILPSTGLYVIARFVGKGFKHQVCDSLEEAAAYALEYDAQGVPTYHACAAYRERSVEKEKPDGTIWHQVRTQANVRALKAFWMDLDVKPGDVTAFESQIVVCDALVDFCARAALPMPLVVSSGGGIHVYWTLTHDINPDQWKQTAAALKALAAKLGFKADPACTSDLARVLRSVGTTNRKMPNSPRPVELIADAEPIVYESFHVQVLAALNRLGVKPPETVKSRESPGEKINEQFAIARDFPPCSAHKVADRCPQLAKMRDTRGVVPEPLWYAGIQLMTHAIEGDELIHQWSNGYSGYTREETNKKISQIRAQSLGPTLCTTFDGRNPGGCDACPFKGKISSPAQLGAEIKSAPPPTVTLQATPDAPPVEITLPNPPAPFTRRAMEDGGGIYMEEEGILHKIYEYDCYPIDITFDENVGYEVMRVRHWLPQEGWQEQSLQSSLLARPTDFEAALRDNSIQPLIRNRMVMYMDSFLRKIRTETKIRRLFRSMGWKERNTKFVLGDRLYQKDGSIIHAGASGRSASFLDGFNTKGSLTDWCELTQIFQQPGLEPHAFMLLTAFAAPLLQLCGREGFTVSALGETGIGKSTMGKFIASVYGYWKDTWIGRNATANARIERLGTYSSVPAYMDEITTIAPEEIREIIYMIPTGKGKDVLTRNRETREGAKWQTILVVSTNDPLQSKLQEAKQNPEAESMRLFEIEFPKSRAFLEFAGLIHQYVEQHYGVAGGEFIRRLVMDQDRLRHEIPLAIDALEHEFQMDKKERFWSQAAALALYGGKLAKDWGIIDFDPECIRPWLLSEIRRMRGDVASNVMSAQMILGEYLNENIGERLVVTRINAGFSASNMRPNRALTQRYEKDSKTLWIARSHLKTWLDKRHHSFNDIKKELRADGVLLNADDKKTLGAGTDMSSGGKMQVRCWKIKVDDALDETLKQEG